MFFYINYSFIQRKLLAHLIVKRLIDNDDDDDSVKYILYHKNFLFARDILPKTKATNDGD